MALHEVLTYLRVLQQALPPSTSQPAHLYHSDDQMGPEQRMWNLPGSFSRPQLLDELHFKLLFQRTKNNKKKKPKNQNSDSSREL